MTSLRFLHRIFATPAIWLSVAVCLLTVPVAGSAQTRQARVQRAEASMRVDGALDEPQWAQAPPIGEIQQREPNAGTVASERTEVRLLYDDNNLYIGVTCWDSDPPGIIATRMGRDSDFVDDDHIDILLDTFHDRRNAYYFSTSPSGALVDALVIENGTLNRDWDAIWVVRTRRTREGWTAEFAIPFKSLTFQTGGTSWGFNFSRTIKRKIEEDRWASPRLDVNFLQVSEAGEISGFSDITQGRGLELRPFTGGRWIRDEAGTQTKSTFTGKPGVDMAYNITPSLKWNATVNTDFGETEVDTRQINLTRFPLFFPEKRQFFLENSGVFNFSDNGNELLPFFSRRIGLSGGQEVPIRFGTKLTGKIGGLDIGLLDARTGETGFSPARNLLVGRVKQTLFRQSYIGAVFTDGDPSSTRSARTFGADVRLGTSSFLGGDRNLSLNAFALKSSNERITPASPTGDDKAFGVGVSFPNDLLDLSANWRRVDKNFRPAQGFVQRPGSRLIRVNFGYSPRPKNFLGVRQMLHEAFFTHYTRLDAGASESWRLMTAPINWRFNSGDHIEFNWQPTFERVFKPFEISPGVILPVGDYQFTRWRVEAFTASKRAVEARLTLWLGDYYSGTAHEIRASLNYKFQPHLQVILETNQTFGRLKEGNFVARVQSLRLNYSFTPFLSLFNLMQYDTTSRNLGWQSRLRWIVQPGNDFFLVLNQGWLRDDQEGLHFHAADTKLAAKVQYTVRF
ncbi:MAG: hypothetical protein EXQ56_03335 [Acidobacteria bacterium]|nr:hypothetical protein [Acidobacteriota bacterium]